VHDCYIDWDNPESIHNLIEQLDFYCKPSWEIGALGAVFLAGIVFGCMTLTRLGDVYGRKPIYVLGILLHITFLVGVLFVKKLYGALLLLLLCGMSISSRYYVGYTFNIEMQPKSHYVLVSTTMFLGESVAYFTICLYFWIFQGKWQLI
jgi:MFS family permease